MTKMETLREAGETYRRISEFVRGLDYGDIPESVVQAVPLLMIDLVGVAIAGHRLEASRIARDYAANHWKAAEGMPSARLLFDGRSVSLPGFGFAAATQIDNLDAHDGWQTSRGHAGAAIFPALCAFAEMNPNLRGREAIVALVIGYEIAYRAAVALHKTVEDYHTSGAWNALGCVAIGARLKGMGEPMLRHAFGIAEYHAPRSQMMREIANPTMLHDGSGFGAPVGIYATLVAEDGFEGAPAALLEFEDSKFAWDDLGEMWLTQEQYIKPWPICRWSHGAIEAALGLRTKHKIQSNQITNVDIHTFAEAAELNMSVPDTSSKAQYSLAWPVAAMLARGKIGVEEVAEESFGDPEMTRITKITNAYVDNKINKTFPQKRLGKVIITTKDGKKYDSGIVEASGGPPVPNQKFILDKLSLFCEGNIKTKHKKEIQNAILSLNEDKPFKEVMNVITKKI